MTVRVRYINSDPDDGHWYVIPAGTDIRVTDGHLHVLDVGNSVVGSFAPGAWFQAEHVGRAQRAN